MKTAQINHPVVTETGQDEVRRERIRAAVRAADQDAAQGVPGLSVDEAVDSMKEKIREVYGQKNASAAG